MAQIELTIGNLIASVTTADARATRILQALLKRHGFDTGTMSGQQQADAAIGVIVDFIVNSATAQEADDATDAAREAVIESPPTWEG